MSSLVKIRATTTNRFLTPDTIVPEPANPQSWNRYSYVHNNPINLVDPSGHSSQKVFTAGRGGAVDSHMLLNDDAGRKAINNFVETGHFDGGVSEANGLYETIAGVMAEPLDWGIALSDGFQWYDSFGMAPFIPSTWTRAMGRNVDEGVAIIRQYIDDSNIHFTIETRTGGRSITTHQTGDLNEKTIKQLDAWEESLLGDLVDERTVDLPNANNAQNFQSASVDLGDPKYNVRTNSCITHVCNVLRVGGVEDVPSNAGGRDLIYIFRNLGFKRNP
ncbi:MAG: RHS repeat-associated core domain-containing protein [Chloroflexota bacterium]